VAALTGRDPRRVAAARRRQFLLGGIAVAVILVSAASLAYALARHGEPATAATGSRPPFRSGGQAHVGGAAREQAAAWVVGQVSPGASVACDRAMCHALEARGFPSSSLILVLPGGASGLGSGVLVDTQAARDMLGSRLAASAPVAIAGFGSGGQRVEVRVVSPPGAPAYRSALIADVAARSAAGAELLHGHKVLARGTARRQLVTGEVDSRLLDTIAGLAANQQVSIVAFGDLPPGASPGVPLRSVELAQPSGAAAAAKMRAFLRAQHGRLAAAHVRPLRLASGERVVQVEFAAPSPLGLLGAGGLPGHHSTPSPKHRSNGPHHH
jgi:hypothetical protein